MKIIDAIAWIILIVGGLNWGLVGAFDVDLVAKIFGAGTLWARVVYMVVGLSAVYQIIQCRCMCSRWCSK